MHLAYTVVRDLLGLLRGPEVIGTPCECHCSVEGGKGSECPVLERLLERRLEGPVGVSPGISFTAVFQISVVVSFLGFLSGVLCGVLLTRRRGAARAAPARSSPVDEGLVEKSEFGTASTLSLRSGRPAKGGKGIIVTG